MDPPPFLCFSVARDKPPAPSPGELQAAHFNAACAHAALGDVDAGLTSVAACVAAGYDDGATLDADPDLAPLGRGALQGAIDAAAKSRGGLVGGLFGGGNKGGAKAKGPSWVERVLRPW